MNNHDYLGEVISIRLLLLGLTSFSKFEMLWCDTNHHATKKKKISMSNDKPEEAVVDLAQHRKILIHLGFVKSLVSFLLLHHNGNNNNNIDGEKQDKEATYVLLKQAILLNPPLVQNQISPLLLLTITRLLILVKEKPQQKQELILQMLEFIYNSTATANGIINRNLILFSSDLFGNCSELLRDWQENGSTSPYLNKCVLCFLMILYNCCLPPTEGVLQQRINVIMDRDANFFTQMLKLQHDDLNADITWYSCLIVRLAVVQYGCFPIWLTQLKQDRENNWRLLFFSSLSDYYAQEGFKVGEDEFVVEFLAFCFISLSDAWLNPKKNGNKAEELALVELMDGLLIGNDQVFLIKHMTFRENVLHEKHRLQLLKALLALLAKQSPKHSPLSIGLIQCITNLCSEDAVLISSAVYDWNAVDTILPFTYFNPDMPFQREYAVLAVKTLKDFSPM